MPFAPRAATLALAFATTLARTGLAVDDTCGYQCVKDEDCEGCGVSGKCSSPAKATKYPAIAASCVDVPKGAPHGPSATAADSKWPDRWTADVRSWTYSDWSDKASVAKGKFYYDGPGGHTRADWHPYINGKNAKQIWIGAIGSEKSAYYVVSGWLCIYFPIHDPGYKEESVSIEAPDWMDRCDKAGMAVYNGREQVDGEWVDHYSCVIEYSKVNQTIVFQNWHTLGLGKLPKGLPVRVTGGNSAPDSKKGSPRLNTVWYTNFTTGDAAVKDEDFKKPGGLCIPVGAEKAKSFLGLEKITLSDLRNAALQRRAHYLPHATPAKSDLARAVRKTPRAEILGATFGEAMKKLNQGLIKEKGLATKACEAFSLEQLHETQQELFVARSPELQALYSGDRRALPYPSESVLGEKHKQRLSWAKAQPEHHDKLRHGLCHELVMMYMHHLTASAREEVKSGAFVLPLLPEGGLHPAPVVAGGIATAAHEDYTNRTSCAICHIQKEAQAAARKELLVV